jgi:hypothetical protein
MSCAHVLLLRQESKRQVVAIVQLSLSRLVHLCHTIGQVLKYVTSICFLLLVLVDRIMFAFVLHFRHVYWSIVIDTGVYQVHFDVRSQSKRISLTKVNRPAVLIVYSYNIDYQFSYRYKTKDKCVDHAISNTSAIPFHWMTPFNRIVFDMCRRCHRRSSILFRNIIERHIP